MPAQGHRPAKPPGGGNLEFERSSSLAARHEWDKALRKSSILFLTRQPLVTGETEQIVDTLTRLSHDMAGVGFDELFGPKGAL